MRKKIFFKTLICLLLGLCFLHCNHLQCRTVLYPSGNKQVTYTVIQGEFEEIPHGLYVTYYENGIHKSLTAYRNGRKEGFFIQWYTSGKLKSRQEFSEGEPLGPEAYWDETGASLNCLAKSVSNNEERFCELAQVTR